MEIRTIKRPEYNGWHPSIIIFGILLLQQRWLFDSSEYVYVLV